MHWLLSKILKTSKPNNYRSQYKWVNGRHVCHTAEPSQEEIKKLEKAIKDFETKIDVEMFKEQIKAYTDGLCHIFDLHEILDIDALAESSYDNYLARLFQNMKYINNHPHVNEYRAGNDLKFDEMEILELYPFLDSIILFANQTTIARRAVRYDKFKLNKSINVEIYKYAKDVFSNIKKKNKKKDKENKEISDEIEVIIPETPMGQPPQLNNSSENLMDTQLSNGYKTDNSIETDLEEFLDEALKDVDLKPKTFDTPISLARANPFNDATTNVNTSYHVPISYKRTKFDEELEPLLGHNDTLYEEDEAMVYEAEFYDGDCEEDYGGC